MASVGTYGDVSFYCKTVKKKNKVLSFHDLTRSGSATYSEHERNGKKAYLEFGADGLDELSLTIEASAAYGVKPLSIEKKLYTAKSKGTAAQFVIGGKKVGKNPFVITSIEETYKTIYADGRPVAIGFSLTLKEYPNKTAKSTKKKNTTTKKKAATSKDAAKSKVKETTSTTYTVVKGDCLWNIAKKYYGKGSMYTKIYNANKDKIKNPNLIYVGQVLTIPK
jgi:nucleoid-associated protein YgaU